MSAGQKQKATAFHQLHHGGRILRLPNAWDAASARVFELAGARAVATTSAGLANAFGYRDGEQCPRDLLMLAVRRISETIALPVTVDLEAGYGETPTQVADSVAAVIDAGGVGINIEDKLLDPTRLVEKIAAIKEVSARADVPLFINARTDVYLHGKGTPEERFAEAVLRLHAYEAAGADGLFAPGLYEPATITRLLGEIGRPLNLLAFAGVPSAPELERLGVARVSSGSGPMRAAVELIRRVAREFLEEGTYGTFTDGVLSHTEANGFFPTRDTSRVGTDREGVTKKG